MVRARERVRASGGSAAVSTAAGACATRRPPTARRNALCTPAAHLSGLAQSLLCTLPLVQAWHRQFGAGRRHVDLLHTALTLGIALRAATRQRCNPAQCMMWLVSTLAVLPVPVLALAAPQHYTAIRTPLLLIIRTIRWTLNVWLMAPNHVAMLHTLGDRPGSKLHLHILLTAPMLLMSSALGFALPLRAHVPVQLLAQAVPAVYAVRGSKEMCHHRGICDWYAHVASSLRALSTFALVSAGRGETLLGGSLCCTLCPPHTTSCPTLALPPPTPRFVASPTTPWQRHRQSRCTLYVQPTLPLFMCLCSY